MDPARREAYREGWRRRRAEADQAEEERWQKAMISAGQIGDRLRGKWGAAEVYPLIDNLQSVLTRLTEELTLFLGTMHTLFE